LEHQNRGGEQPDAGREQASSILEQPEPILEHQGSGWEQPAPILEQEIISGLLHTRLRLPRNWIMMRQFADGLPRNEVLVNYYFSGDYTCGGPVVILPDGY